MTKDAQSREEFSQKLSAISLFPDEWPDGVAASPSEILALKQIKLLGQILKQMRQLVAVNGADPDAP